MVTRRLPAIVGLACTLLAVLCVEGVRAGAPPPRADSAGPPVVSSPAWPKRLESVPALDPYFEGEEQRAKTVTILGSSRSSDPLKPYMLAAESLARDLVLRGFHVLTGCGSAGIMGAAYRGASTAANLPPGGSPRGENRVILIRPLWEPCDFTTARAIGIAESEGERIEKFRRASRTFVIFPGGAATLQEIATLVTMNRYSERFGPRRKLLLVDRRFYAGLAAQYRKQEQSGTLGAPVRDLLRIVDSPERVLRAILE